MTYEDMLASPFLLSICFSLEGIDDDLEEPIKSSFSAR